MFDIDFVWSENKMVILEASPRLGGNSISKLIHTATNKNIINNSHFLIISFRYQI